MVCRGAGHEGAGLSGMKQEEQPQGRRLVDMQVGKQMTVAAGLQSRCPAPSRRAPSDDGRLR
eukprot:scaffold122434_cov18-Tisochrysis_lutea.AAC.3